RADSGSGSSRRAAIRASIPSYSDPVSSWAGSGPAYSDPVPSPSYSGPAYSDPAPSRDGSRASSWAVMSHHLVFVQAGAQGPYGGVQPALDRALRHAELLGDGPHRQVRVETQHDDLALRVGQPVQAPGDGEGEHAGLLTGGSLRGPQRGQPLPQPLLAALGPVPVHGEVRGDDRRPRRDVPRCLPATRGPLQQPQADLL